MSMIFTPSLSADGRTDCSVHLQLYVAVTHRHTNWRCWAWSTSLTVVAPSLLIHLYRMVQGWTSRELGKEGAPYCALHPLHRMLLRLFLLDGIPQYATCHQHHRSGSAGDTDDLCHHQCMVEDQHPYGSHRWRGRRSGILFHSLRFQSAVVALLCAADRAGAVGSARMILRQHTLSQVVAGFLIGIACAAYW